MSILTPPQIESLSREIGNRLDFEALDIIVFKSLGRREINAIANREWPTVRTASACLMAVEHEGTTMAFLYYCVEARRDQDAGFRGVVIALVPGLDGFVLAAGEGMGQVVGELLRTGTRIEESAVRAALEASKDALERLVDDVEVLDAHKILHDSLHQLQLRQFATLQDAARTLAQPASIDALRNFQDRMHTACATASSTVARLKAPSVRNQQEIWVDDLIRTTAALQAALDDRVTATAMQALHKVRLMLEREPSQINRIIFATAKSLRLGELIDALRAVGAAAGDEPNSAADALRDIRAVLLGRVVEHQLWQDADDSLWAYDQIFMLPVERLFGDFDALWPATRTMLADLANQERGAAWSANVLRYVAQVDLALTRLEVALAALEGAAPGPDAQQRGEELRQHFGDVRAEARVRFFVVDQTLKADCAALVRIGEPLKLLLARLENG